MSARRGGVAGLVLALVLLWGASSARAASVRLGFPTEVLDVAPGTTFTLQVVALEGDVPFNALDLGLLFDPSAVSFVPTSPLAKQRGLLFTSACATTFHRFASYTDSLAATVVLLCNETTVSGAGVVYQVRFQALPGNRWSRIRLGANTRVFMGGALVPQLPARDVWLRIGSPPPLDVAPGAGTRALAFAAPWPNPARSEHGVGLRFDLAQPSEVSVELLDAAGRRVAHEDLGTLAAGRHALPWRPSGVAPGRYVLRLRTGAGEHAERSWVLLR